MDFSYKKKERNISSKKDVSNSDTPKGWIDLRRGTASPRHNFIDHESVSLPSEGPHEGRDGIKRMGNCGNDGGQVGRLGELVRNIAGLRSIIEG